MIKKRRAADPDQPQKPKKKKKLLVIGLATLLLVAAGALTALKLFGGGEAAAAEQPPPVEEGDVVEVAEMTSSLAGAQPHYARVGVAVVLSAGASEDVVAPRFPLLKDAAITEITKLTPRALRTPKGVEDLRRRLTRRAKGIYPDGEVLRVVLTEFIVQ